MTDTGGFRFRSTSATTHRIVADLIEKGADPAVITSNTWDTNTISRLHLLSLVLSRIELTKEGKVAIGTGDVAVSPGNVVHDVAVNAKNACNSGQSKVKEKKAEENKELPPSAPPEGKEEERKEDSVSLPIPGYAFNTMTHNYPGLTDTLKRLGITEAGEVNAILRLSDYGRKGTRVWQLIANTCWSDIGAKGRYLIAALNKAKRK